MLHGINILLTVQTALTLQLLLEPRGNKPQQSHQLTPGALRFQSSAEVRLVLKFSETLGKIFTSLREEKPLD